MNKDISRCVPSHKTPGTVCSFSLKEPFVASLTLPPWRPGAQADDPHSTLAESSGLVCCQRVQAAKEIVGCNWKTHSLEPESPGQAEQE